MRVAVLNVVTGKYIDYFEQLKDSVEENFFNEDEVDIFLFTDTDREYGDNVKKIKIERGGWPNDTLYRYHYFLMAKEELMKYDLLLYLDVDLKVVSKVGREMVGDLVAVQHPGFYGKTNGTYERRRTSTAYVPATIKAPYYCGGLQGGRPEHYLKACEIMSKNIDIDKKNSIIAIWHDESHWNKYLSENKPETSLDPSYCYPTDCYFEWVQEFSSKRKIETVEKDEEGLKKEITVEDEYKNYLKGKRVVLVGPSKTLSMQEEGELIDSYDVVVRLNNMLNIPDDMKKHLGSRTDVVYATLDDPPKKMAIDCVKNKVKFLSSSYPRDEWFFPERMLKNVMTLKKINKFKTVVIPNEPYFSIKKHNKTRPNTGFSAIIDLLSSDLKELHIIGIDFYRSVCLEGENSYIKGYECQWTKKPKKDFLKIEYDGPDRHDSDNDFTFFKKEMYEKDERIKVDKFMKLFLSDSKYDSLSNLI